MCHQLGTSVIRISNGGTDFYEGWLLEAFQEISLRLNFRYCLATPRNNRCKFQLFLVCRHVLFLLPMLQ